jgi:uncharacterized membrane protein YkvA (DUF1232 family)
MHDVGDTDERPAGSRARAGNAPAPDDRARRGDNDGARVGETQRIRAVDLDPGMRVPRDAYDRFHALLQDAARHFGGRWGRDAMDLLLMVPDLLLLFAGLARDPRVGRRHKLLAGAVVAYLLSPIDFMPEALLGPLGMADDIALAFLALDALLNQLPRDVLLDHWRGEGDLLEVARLGTVLGRRLVPKPVYDRVVRWLAKAGTRPT